VAKSRGVTNGKQEKPDDTKVVKRAAKRAIVTILGKDSTKEEIQRAVDLLNGVDTPESEGD
jgi:hypothetical protein